MNDRRPRFLLHTKSRGDTVGDFLSQEEVDALLRGVCEGDGDFSFSEERDREPREYNLGTQERIVRGRMPTLEIIHERFARKLRENFFRKFKRATEISVGPVRVQKYSEFIRNLVCPTSFNVMESRGDVEGHAVIVLDPNLIFLTVDSVFGSDGRFHTRVEGRDFSPTENIVIDELIETIVSSYSISCKRYLDWTFDFKRREMNSQFVNITTPGEIVVAVTFTIEMGGAWTDFHIMIPYCNLEPAIGTLTSAINSEQESTGKTVPISGVTVRLSAQAPVEGMTFADIAALKTGDTLVFDGNVELIANAGNKGRDGKGRRIGTGVIPEHDIPNAIRIRTINEDN